MLGSSVKFNLKKSEVDLVNPEGGSNEVRKSTYKFPAKSVASLIDVDDLDKGSGLLCDYTQSRSQKKDQKPASIVKKNMHSSSRFTMTTPFEINEAENTEYAKSDRLNESPVISTGRKQKDSTKKQPLPRYEELSDESRADLEIAE